MESVKRRAYAKINLGLDVIRKRPDGYHEVKMIMQTVDIWDELTFKKRTGPGIFLSVEMDTPAEMRDTMAGALTAAVSGGKGEVPENQENLVYRAANMIRQRYGIKEGIEITLKKSIPVAAGMAGGSTDAAAVFHGLKELFRLEMTQEEMQAMGVKLGADIPYCIMGGTALSEGIGEVLTPLPAPPDCHLAVAKPDISVSTKFVYENLHPENLERHPDIDGMVEAIRAGSLPGITKRLGNVLETVTAREYPVIEDIKKVMRKSGAENALMSGSGPTVFGIFREREDAERAACAIKEAGLAMRVFATGFVPAGGRL